MTVNIEHLPELMTALQVAQWLNVSERTIWRWAASGLLPPPVHPRKRCSRWLASDIDLFVQKLNCPQKPKERGA